jgi:transcriptional regulator with XRE-family HTH domain
METFGIRLSELRKKRGLTQSQLAERVGMSKSTIASWEIGTRDPNSEMIARLAEFFNVSTDFLLGQTNDYKEIKSTNFDSDEQKERGIEFITRSRERLSPEAYKDLLEWSEKMAEILEKQDDSKSK